MSKPSRPPPLWFGRALAVAQHQDAVNSWPGWKRWLHRKFLYCPDGPCAKLPGGDAANDGEAGPTEREAYLALVDAVDWVRKNL